MATASTAMQRWIVRWIFKINKKNSNVRNLKKELKYVEYKLNNFYKYFIILFKNI